MKALAFGDQAATIGGKRVPYSLLGAGAAILGALLIWMQFRQSGGFTIGGQSPDLSSLVGGGGGGASGIGDLSSAGPDFGALGVPSFFNPTYPIPNVGAPALVYGPSYAAAIPAQTMSTTVVSDVLPSPAPSYGGSGTGFSAGSSYVAPSSAPVNTAPVLGAPPAPAPSAPLPIIVSGGRYGTTTPAPVPSSGGSSTGFTF